MSIRIYEFKTAQLVFKIQVGITLFAGKVMKDFMTEHKIASNGDFDHDLGKCLEYICNQLYCHHFEEDRKNIAEALPTGIIALEWSDYTDTFLVFTEINRKKVVKPKAVDIVHTTEDSITFSLDRTIITDDYIKYYNIQNNLSDGSYPIKEELKVMLSFISHNIIEYGEVASANVIPTGITYAIKNKHCKSDMHLYD